MEKDFVVDLHVVEFKNSSWSSFLGKDLNFTSNPI